MVDTQTTIAPSIVVKSAQLDTLCHDLPALDGFVSATADRVSLIRWQVGPTELRPATDDLVVTYHRLVI